MSAATSQQAERWQLFTSGSQCVFQRWTALQLAIDHQMAGITTSQRSEELLEHTCAFFEQYRTEVMPHEIAENLKAFFDEVFNAELDDGSPEQIGKTLVQLYRDVVVDGRTEEVTAMIRKAQETASAAGASIKVGGDDSSSDEGSDDDDDEEDRDPNAPQPMDVDGPAPSGSSSSQPRPEPVVDEDGFELVQPKKGRRRN
ncbi:hypothetical protein HKX48_002535 [Thoreauomyces humboldtii]|nr:hypothetical protein HKX48_002535 [Thoreauomyces humboldtii]